VTGPVPLTPYRQAIGADIPNMLRPHARTYRAQRIPPLIFRQDAIGELILAAAILVGDEVNLELLRDASIHALQMIDQKNWTFADLARDAGRTEGGVILP
jgi:hypothetical protein